jgi:hypothetical protein
MRQGAIRSGMLLFAVLVLTTCSRGRFGGGAGSGGGGGGGTGSGSAPFALTITDAPPAGVTVLTFQLTITGAVLQPNSVPLINAPRTIDLTQLQNESAVLGTPSIPTGTYTSLTLTFSTASLTILNSTGAAIGSCANGTICAVTPPSITPLSVTLSTASFPLTVTSNTPAGIQLEALLSNILQPDLSVNLAASNAITATQLPTALLTTAIAEVDDVVGQVTSVGTNQFTLLPLSGLTLTSSVNSSTAFSFPISTCTVQSFSCVAVNQIDEVDLSLLGSGTFLAKTVAQDDIAGQTEVQGTIVSVQAGSPPSQFKMVVNGVVPPVTGVTPGSLATVTISNGATFAIDANAPTLPSGVSFASGADLVVGQNVMVRETSVTTTSGIAITTSHLLLRLSQITAQVGTINIGGANFTLVGLSSLFTTASPNAINQILVQTSSQTQFFNLSPLSVAGLAAGNNLSVKGLLFNTFRTVGNPTLVAEKVRGRTVNGL